MSPANDNAYGAENAGAEDDGGAKGPEGSMEENRIVGPLTDDELRTGGMRPVVSFVREEQSQEALRKKKQRKKQKEEGKRQINIILRDDERARTTMRAAATAIEDDAVLDSLEELLVNEDLSQLVARVVARPDLQAAAIFCQQPLTAIGIDLAQLMKENPGLASAIKRAVATTRMRKILETALAHPKFVLLGYKIATSDTVCVRLARAILRVRRVRNRTSKSHD